jgi:hypothetical protein
MKPEQRFKDFLGGVLRRRAKVLWLIWRCNETEIMLM